MITTKKDTQGLANLYATMLVITCSRNTMANLRHIGLCCTVVVEVANVRLEADLELTEVRDILSELAATGLTTTDKSRIAAADRWAQARCQRAEERGLLGHTYLSGGDDDNRRRKYFFLTKQGEEEYEQMDSEFDLVYLKSGLRITGLGVVRRS